MIHFRQSIFLYLLWVATCSVSRAQDSSVVATVNGQPVSLNVVHRFLDRSFQNLPDLSDRTKRDDSVIQIGIEHCIKQELVLQHLRAGKFKTSEDEIDTRLVELKTQLELTAQNLDVFLAELKLSEQELRREIEWKTSWRKYVTNYVTVEHLKKQFDEKRKYFDGTKYHVAQILWKQDTAETKTKAAKVRRQLMDREIDWPKAVKKHSQSASAKNDGDLGWIQYAGPMPRGFTRMAFELKPEQISQPYASKFGTHLIRCIEVTPGTKTFEEVVLELRERETNRLFDLVASRQRQDANIEVRPTQKITGDSTASPPIHERSSNGK